MKFLHTMVRVLDLDKSLKFFVDDLGLKEVRRKEVPQGKFTLVFLSAEKDGPEIELTYNWGESDPYSVGRSFGHLAFQVEDIYQKCEELQNKGVTILRPPRDGYMAFIKSPDGISVELLQKGQPLPEKEPWKSQPSVGTW
ncbi:MAG: lactoylglutathione lyase [Halobacteriovoraceae bacterium]|nr:lactoylglutathione lyase [Halobacteriovoraceae bacterium]